MKLIEDFYHFQEEKYKIIFIEYCIISCIEFPEIISVYTLMSDKIINENDINIFNIIFINNGINIYYCNNLIQRLEGLTKEDGEDMRNTFFSMNPNFGKKYLETLINNNINDKDFLEQIGYSFIQNPNINIDYIIKMFGENIIKNKEYQLNYGYNNFTMEEIFIYREDIDWIVLLTETKILPTEIIKNFRYQIYDFFFKNISNDFEIIHKFLLYLICCSETTKWEEIKYYMENLFFQDLPHTDCLETLSENIKFPYQYYYNGLVNRNFEIFEKFKSNFSEDCFYNNIHIPSEIIQILIDEHLENPDYSNTLRKLNYEKLKNLTFQQIILLHKFGFLNYQEMEFSTTSFGVYQMKKYIDIVSKYPELFTNLINKIFDSDNGREEFEIDKK